MKAFYTIAIFLCVLCVIHLTLQFIKLVKLRKEHRQLKKELADSIADLKKFREENNIIKEEQL